MHQLVLFADFRSALAAALVDAFLRAAAGVEGIRPVGVVDATPRPPPARARRIARDVALPLVKRAFDPRHRVVVPRAAIGSIESAARRRRLPVLVPPGRDVNDPAFLRDLHAAGAPTLALSCGCVQVFGRELLARFERAVNYHNGLLPDYRGLHATAWSVYHGEPATGFAFHRMEEGIDTGPVLATDAVPVSPGATTAELEARKTALAAAGAGRVLAMLRDGEAGRPQSGRGSYFGRKALRRIRSLDDPAAHTWAELQRRLRAFEILWMTIGGRTHPVTRLQARPRARATREGPAFVTRDGVWVEATRFWFLPGPLYRLGRRWRPVGEP